MQDSQPADGDSPTPAPDPVPAAPVPAEADPALAGPAAPLQDLSPAACAALLAEHFPGLFGPGPRKPLKLRIQADIQQRQPGVYTRRALSAFLHRHTTTTAYLIALTQAAHRFDLDGQPAGELSAEHRDAATAELARRREIHEGRRRAEQRAAQAQANERHAAQAAEQAAELQARQARAVLLRSFETSTLTRANFCALKGLRDEDLEAQLAQAREERRLAPPAPAGPPSRPQAPGRSPRPAQAGRPGHEGREGRSERPPRRDGGPPAGKPAGKPRPR